MQKKLFVIGILSLLSTFQSCNNNEELSTNEKNSSIEKTTNSNRSRLTSDSKTLPGYISNILSIQAEVKSILESERNANFTMIQSEMQNVKTVEDLKLLYRNANVTHVEELLSLYENMSSNSEVFIKSNSDFYSNYSEEKRSELIINEIDNQLGYIEGDLMARTNCQANFTKASRRCMRNYAISMGLAGASGLISFGAGTIIAGAGATIMMVACNSDAEDDYQDCVHDGGTP